VERLVSKVTCAEQNISEQSALMRNIQFTLSLLLPWPDNILVCKPCTWN